MQVQRYNGPVVSEIASMETLGELADRFDWGVCRRDRGVFDGEHKCFQIGEG